MTTLNEVTRTINSQNIPIFTRELDLSIIVPTRNEAGNIEKLLSGIQQALLGKKVERSAEPVGGTPALEQAA